MDYILKEDIDYIAKSNMIAWNMLEGKSILITGATGFLGRAVSQKLASCSIPVRALVLSNDPYAEQLPKGVQRVTGDVLDKESLEAFFDGAGIHTCVIHCAGIVPLLPIPIRSSIRSMWKGQTTSFASAENTMSAD